MQLYEFLARSARRIFPCTRSEARIGALQVANNLGGGGGRGGAVLARHAVDVLLAPRGGWGGLGGYGGWREGDSGAREG